VNSGILYLKPINIEMMSFSPEIIGIIAGTLSCFTFIPQIIRVLKTKSVKDISFSTYLIVLISEFGWFFYGCCIGSLSIVLTTIVACLSAMYILYLKLKLDKEFSFQKYLFEYL